MFLKAAYPTSGDISCRPITISFTLPALLSPMIISKSHSLRVYGTCVKTSGKSNAPSSRILSMQPVYPTSNWTHKSSTNTPNCATSSVLTTNIFSVPILQLSSVILYPQNASGSKFLTHKHPYTLNTMMIQYHAPRPNIAPILTEYLMQPFIWTSYIQLIYL